MASKPITVSLGRLGYRAASAAIALDWRIRPSRGRGVKMIIERSDAALLLVRHTYGNRHWTLPGGRMRSDEDPITAANREIAEELGVLAGKTSLIGTYPLAVGRRRERIEVVRCTDLVGAISPSPIEIEEAAWFDHAEIPKSADPQIAIAKGLLDGHVAELQVS